MFPVEAFRSTVMKFAAILKDHSIAFHLTGGVTSTAYGEPRMTQDIDIVIGNESLSGCLESFLQSLDKSDFLHDQQSIRDAVKSKGMFQLLDNEESLKLDVYPRELVEGELERSDSIEIFSGIWLPVVSRQDAAVSKLIWVQKGSHKSRRDFRKIWQGCEVTQCESIETLVVKLGLQDLMNEVLDERDEIS